MTRFAMALVAAASTTLLAQKPADARLAALLEFNEIAWSTIIRSPDAEHDMVSRGSVHVEPETGRLWKGDVRVLVPKQMREEFSVGFATGYGEAVSRNFRRFTTAAGILPQ
jgi:hypothetical protein